MPNGRAENNIYSDCLYPETSHALRYLYHVMIDAVA